MVIKENFFDDNDENDGYKIILFIVGLLFTAVGFWALAGGVIASFKISDLKLSVAYWAGFSTLLIVGIVCMVLFFTVLEGEI